MPTGFRPRCNRPWGRNVRAPILPQNWPYRTQSRHIRHGAHLWHVQIMGDGPVILLLHGAGGASHSFRHLMPLLQPAFRLIAIDLPGQGFTLSGARHRSGLDAMAADIAALSAAEGWAPDVLLGHSAGAAIALRLAELAPPRAVIGINAALGSFEGVAGWLFPVLARLLSRLPMVPQLFSKFAGTPAQVHQLLASTGSHLGAEGESMYLQLLRQPSHVAATLAMMAQWDLTGLLSRLPHLSLPCLFLTADDDKAVPAKVSERAAARMPNALWHNIPGFGHLVHEEAPEPVAQAIRAFLVPNLTATPALKASP